MPQHTEVPPDQWEPERRIAAYLAETQLPPQSAWIFVTSGDVLADATALTLDIHCQLPPFRLAPDRPPLGHIQFTFQQPDGAPPPLVARWAGHRVEFFGRLQMFRCYGYESVGLTGNNIHDWQGPYWRIRGNSPDNEQIAAQLWRQRAYPIGRTDLYIEQRWWPSLPEAVPAICGSALRTAGAAGARALAQSTAALVALQLAPPDARGTLQAKGPGRTRLEESEATYWREAVKRAEAIKIKEPHRHWDHIARHVLNVHPATLRDWRKRYHDEQRAG